MRTFPVTVTRVAPKPRKTAAQLRKVMFSEFAGATVRDHKAPRPDRVGPMAKRTPLKVA